MLNDLLCCPFCGGKDIDTGFAFGYEGGDMNIPVIGAGCNSCGATGPMVRIPDNSTGEKEAGNAWNRRAMKQHGKPEQFPLGSTGCNVL